MNKTFRSVWNARKQTYVAAAETVSAKGKPSSGVQLAATVAALLGGLLGQVAHAQTAPPPNTLPTGGQVAAGQASIGQSGANMVIQQGSDRASINWQTFNVGKDAQVQFQQPGASSVTLNRVLSADPSQIFGRISANGQVILTNPAGVYFGKDARVDVGGIVATTHSISDADFMAGKNRFERNGSTASVVNEGEIKASLGGYIALLAPEVRNQGAIIAQMGTVALAAGEAIDLHFDSNNRLTSIRVEPSQIQALVDNRYAVQAPGGLIILSAQSMDRLVGGVVKNSGRIEANGLQQQGGRIVLSASAKVENTSSISANATAGATAADSGPAGKIQISAPEVLNSGSISATGAVISTNTGDAPHSAGSVLIQATNVTQTTTGRIDLSAPQQGGTLSIQSTGKVQLQGQVDVSATQDQASNPPTQGGQIDIAAGGDIEVTNATLDASGGQGGQIQLRAAAPAQSDNPNPLPDVPNAPSQGHLAIMGSSTLNVRGRSGKGGSAALLGDHIDLLDATQVDATGATGGGTVLVGGDWQGRNGVYQATTVKMGEKVVIDASATQQGEGGKLVLWSDVHNADSVTTAQGSLYAKGGQNGGNGGQIETSGARLEMGGQLAVNAGSTAGQGGLWLIDPYNYIINATAAGNISGALNVGTSVTVSTATSNTNYGGSTNSSDAGTISIDSAIAKTGGNAVTLTLQADSAISGAANISNTSGNLLSLVFNVGASSGTYSGAISGSTQVTKAGVGTLILSGTSTYTGATNVNAGTLKITDTGHLYNCDVNNSCGAFGSPGTAITTVNSGAVLEATNLTWGGAFGTQYYDAFSLVINGGTLRYSGATANAGFGHGFTVGSSGATFESATAGTNWSFSDNSSNPLYKHVFNGSVTLAGAGDFTFGPLITNPATGSNTVTKNGSGTATLLENNTYTGATNINAGTLVLQNDAPTKGTSGFYGPGALRIEPTSASFTNDFSTTGWTFGSSLGGLTLGKDGNTKNMTVAAVTSIAGSINIYGGNINLNGNLASTLSGAAILAKASGAVTQAASVAVSTNGGSVTYWADSDNSGSGNILLSAGTSASNTSITSNGGAITLGGGTDPLTGYAKGTNVGGQTQYGVNLAGYDKLNAGTGAISLRGSTAETVSNWGIGVRLIDSSSLIGGDISLTGIGSANTGSYGSNWGVAMEIASTITASGTLTITGTGGGSNSIGGGNNGIYLDGATLTSSGDMTLTGTGGGKSGGNLGNKGVEVFGGSTLRSGAGAMTLIGTGGYNGSSEGISVEGTSVTNTLGSATSGAQTGNITLRADSLWTGSFNTNQLLGSGTATIEPLSASFSGTLYTSGLTLGSTLTGLTIGKLGNTADIIVTSGYGASIAGPISIYGGNIAINAGLTTTGSNTITLAGSGNVTQTAALSTDKLLLLGGAVTLDQANTIATSTTLQTGALGVYANTALGVGSLIMGDGTSLTLGRAVTNLANNISLLGAATLGLDSNVDYLIVGGGGGGGNAYDYGAGGGGGGGGMLVGTASFSGGSGVSVTVGAGGAGGSAVSSPTSGSNGGNSSVGALVASGGGGGGGSRAAGLSGGSGGGAGGRPGTQTLLGGAGTAGQGYAGGDEVNAQGGAGGGGAGGAGANSAGNNGSAGGAGLASTITGSPVTYAIGGTGGGGYPSGTGVQQNGLSAAANLGNGGGGASTNAQLSSAGGTGGSGIVIVRYKGASAGTGGTVSTGTGSSTGYTLQTFTSGGTLALGAMTPTLSGVISGSGGLTVNANDGSVTFTGVNTYSGNTSITGGAVVIGGAGSLGSGTYAGAISNAGTFKYSSSAGQLLSGTISGAGTLIKDTSATSTLTLTGNNSYSGATTIGAGTLQIGNGGTSGTLGTAAVTDNAALVFNRSDDVTVANAISGSGTVTKSGSNTLTLTANGSYSGVTTISGGTLVLSNNAPTTGSSSFAGPGAFRIEPTSNDFTSAFSTSGWTLGSTLGGLTIGKASSADGASDVAVTIPSAISIAGPISIYGGNITLNAGLTANAITLKASGNVTDGASGYVSASNLLLLGGNVTLSHADNAIGTLAASGVGSLTYVDKDALTLGTVGSTNGVSAGGAVSIGTKTGDLTVAQNVATTNATVSALTLNAGIDAAAGTSTGGNLILSNSPTISVGSGGIGKLYAGSISGSTGLTGLTDLASGSGRFRYNSDESATNYTAALVTGLNAIYREQPATTVAVGTTTMTYGDTLPTLGTASNLVNGDTARFDITGRVNSTSGNIQYNATPYAVTNTNLAALGYSVTGAASGALTVTQRTLTLTGFIANSKEYNGNTTATFTAPSLNGVVGSDTVNVSNSGATFSDKNVGTGKTVTLNGVAINGTDAGNYSIDSTSLINSADITARTVTLSASKTYDGTTGLTGNVTVGTGVNGENLTYTGATASDAHVATASNYINAITLGDQVGASASSGGLVSNYQLPTLNAANAPLTITAATLTPTLSNSGVSKTYDGTTNAPGGFTPTYSFSGLVSGDTATLTTATGVAYNSKDVATANLVTVSGLGIANITGSKGSLASDYVLDTTSKTVSATITKAPLTVRANDDANFVTQTKTGTDTYAGVSYSGFVGGETQSSSGVLTAGTIARTSNLTTAATCSGDLVPSGWSAANYAVSYTNGNYTIVPANQLLVKVTPVQNTYGTVTTYTVSEAKYLASDGSTITDLTNSFARSGTNNNTITITDGTSGTASFTLAPASGANSTADKLKVGSYQLAASGAAVTTANFSNTITVVGSHQVDAKGLAAFASSGVSKVYDGTTSINGVTVGLSGLENNGATPAVSDVVTVNGIGAFGSKNAGSNLSYTISNLALSGSDAGNYYLSGGGDLSGSNGAIDKANATVTANSSNVTYNGLTQSVSGFTATGLVVGESASVLSGVSASGTGKNAGSYDSVATGTDANYNLTFVKGTLAIDPAALSVTANNASKTYDGVAYTGGNGVAYSGFVDSETSSVLGGTLGYAGTSQGAKNAGSYLITPQGLTSANYAVSFVDGSLTISAAGLSAIVGSLTGTTSKVYDGNTTATLAPGNFAFTGFASGEGASVTKTSGSYDTANAGTGKTVTVNLSNSDYAATGSTLLSNYTLPTSVSGSIGTITQAPLSVSGLTASSKTYDGQTTASVTTTATSFNGKFGSDDVTIAAVTGNFTDKNVGNRKNINITGITLGGSAAGNYQLTSTTARTRADITRLNTVTWTGGSTGNWFDPANWAGGAVPDLSNVANVVIPGGVAVSFGSAVVAPAQSGAVNIDSLSGSGGTLSQTAGTLNVGTGGATLGGLTQSGGNITLMGPLTVSQGFSQDNAGAIIVGGSTSITDTSGGVQLGNLSSTGPLTVNSTDGAITQPAGTVNTAYGTSSFTATQGTNPAMPADIALTNAGNDFVGRVNASGSNVTLNDKNSLALGTLSTTGNLNLVSNGALELGTSTVAGTLNAKSGNGAITQTGVINVVGLATFDAGSGEITLTNPDNRFPQGTKIIAASSVIAGDAQAESQAAFKQVLDAMPKTTLPGVNSFSLAAPAPLVMSSVTPTTSQSGSTSSTTATAGGGNSAGVSIDVDRAPATQAVMMAAVSLPKGTSTAGAGFSFELPETVRSLAQAGLIAKATQLDGTSLPAWLRFNAESLRFEAAAVPDGAFPLQVVVLISGQRVLVVISERNT